MRTRGSWTALFIIFSALFVHGCVSTVFRPASEGHALRTQVSDPSAVRLLVSPPSPPAQVLGEIEAYISGHVSEDAVLRRVRRQAAQIGANAIVFQRTMTTYAQQIGDVHNGGPQTSNAVYTAFRVPDQNHAPSSP